MIFHPPINTLTETLLALQDASVELDLVGKEHAVVVLALLEFDSLPIIPESGFYIVTTSGT